MFEIHVFALIHRQRLAPMDYDKLLENLLGRSDYLVVGKSVTRSDALDKCLGSALFAADYIPRGTRVLKVLRSTEAHALIKRIDATEALSLPGIYAVITGADVPGENQIGYALPDQPLLNDKKVHYIGDPIALIVARDAEAAQEALEAVKVEYKPLKPVLDIDAALTEGAPVIHKDNNVALTTIIRKGDAPKGFKKAKAIVEETYLSPYQEHMYLEPDVAYAIPEGSSKITIVASSQSPHLAREKVAHVLGWRLNQVRIVVPYTGGGFGKKDDTAPLCCAYVALAAVKTGKPVALVYDRSEIVGATPKRFPARISYKSGADKNGLLTAIEVDITLECGAYANRAPFWLWRQTAHAAGPYVVPNAWIDGRAVYTTKVYGGSYRGFGNVALHFAAEQQIDKLAYELKMDPLEFRLKNCLRVGTKTTCDQLLDHSVGIDKCIEGVRKTSKWDTHREPVWNGTKVTGWGIGCAYHGNSTSRSTPDFAGASLIMNQDGTLTYRTGICEIGQGSPFGHLKIVAEIIGAKVEDIRIEQPDTDSTLDAHPTHASRGAMMGGTAAADATVKLRENMIKVAAEMLECKSEEVELQDSTAYKKKKPSNRISFSDLADEMHNRGVTPASYGFYAGPKRFFDPETGLGVNYSCYTFAATIAEVEVDTETGQIAVKRIFPAMDVGKALDSLMIEGQIHGAVSHGMGFALTEHLQLKDGRVINPNMKDYLVPSALDTPEIADSVLVEEPYKYSVFGIKGVGEPSIISIVPAIVNAVYHATGIRSQTLPLTPDRFYKLLKETKK